EVRNVNGKPQTVQVPIPMPEGVSYEGVFGAEECESSVGYGGAMKAPSSVMHLNGGGGRVKTESSQDIGEFYISADRDDKSALVASVEFEAPTILGSLTEPQVSAVLDAREEDLVDIYEKYLAKDASISGRAVFGITVKADGSVENVVVKSSTLGNKDFESALTKELKRLRFPAPADGGKVVITVAIVFKT
ncbi:TonB family protein, partial [candidate division WOR-3 bacterium]|nr:TonB family protein [candidate division WOR-3 bacterium]